MQIQQKALIQSLLETLSIAHCTVNKQDNDVRAHSLYIDHQHLIFYCELKALFNFFN